MILEVVVAFFATLAFSVLFSAPRHHWLFCGLVGAIGWLVYTASMRLGYGPFLAAFLATLSLTIVARICSYRRRAPVTLFLIAGIFPLVPGAGIYYTVYYLFASDFTASLLKGVETMKSAGAITLGILIGFSLPARLFRWPKRPGRD